MCEQIQLSKTQNGQVYRCTKCNGNVCLMYKNIVQGLVVEDFYKLKDVIDAIDVEAFFSRYPDEQRLSIRTAYSELFFAFSASELYELRALMTCADLKIKLYERIQNNVN
jgi:hypothetical protein